MSEEKIHSRRSFLENILMTLGGAELAMMRYRKSHFVPGAINNASKKNAIRYFDQLKQINAGELNVGYVDSGPNNGVVIILLHGWPYDIHSFIDVPLILTA